VFYVVETCSAFDGLSIANADKKCQGTSPTEDEIDIGSDAN